LTPSIRAFHDFSFALIEQLCLQDTPPRSPRMALWQVRLFLSPFGRTHFDAFLIAANPLLSRFGQPFPRSIQPIQQPPFRRSFALQYGRELLSFSLFPETSTPHLACSLSPVLFPIAAIRRHAPGMWSVIWFDFLHGVSLLVPTSRDVGIDITFLLFPFVFPLVVFGARVFRVLRQSLLCAVPSPIERPRRLVDHLLFFPLI